MMHVHRQGAKATWYRAETSCGLHRPGTSQNRSVKLSKMAAPGKFQLVMSWFSSNSACMTRLNCEMQGCIQSDQIQVWKPILQTSFSSILETYPSKFSGETKGETPRIINHQLKKSKSFMERNRWWLLFPHAL